MSHNRWLTMILLLLVVNLGLIGFTYFQFAIRSPGDFYGVPSTDKPFELVALDRPNVSTKALLSWVTLAATASFTFDFVNYQDQLKALHDYFTADGFDNFMLALQNANTLSKIDEEKLVLTAVAVGPAIILTEGAERSGYTWRVQVPLLVRYQSASVNETRIQVVDVLVTQVPTSDAPKGIGIAQYIAREAGPEVIS